MPRERLLKRCEGVEGILCLLTDRIDREVMVRAGPKLKVISVMAAGYDNVDLSEATRRGIVVGNTPGVLTEAAADLTWALILAVSRKIVEGDRLMRSGRFTGWAPMLLLGADFSGRTLGVVGMGRIGKAVAKRALGFGMHVIYFDSERLEPALEQELHVQYVLLHELIAKADFVCLHCPLTNETRHLIGARELSMMKPGAYLINVSRGPVVDEQALVAALRQGRIAGAALDVYEQEPLLAAGLAELSNVILAPHLGSASLETRNKMAVMAARNLLAGISGRVPPYCVNPPARDR
jgi:glyoxylate reductase